MSHDKIVPVDSLFLIDEKMKVVFTNGVFDILHRGHVEFLEDAAQLGDLLIVAVNTDYSVKKLKKSHSLINNEWDRSRVLSSLECVDYVTWFDDETPLSLIALIKPDVLVKGGDYTVDTVVGRELVESYGGEVVIIPYIEGYSTTNLIDHIKCN